jgi:uncharacterized membrane protein
MRRSLPLKIPGRLPFAGLRRCAPAHKLPVNDEPRVRLLPYVKAASIGAAAGLRSLSPPAAVFRSHERWRAVLAVLALGELVGDKFPQAPSRLFPPALILRSVTGGICGGEIATRGKGARAVGIVVGSLAAIAASYAGYAVRMNLTETRKFPGFPTAAAEDAITLLLIQFGLRAV